MSMNFFLAALLIFPLSVVADGPVEKNRGVEISEADLVEFIQAVSARDFIKQEIEHCTFYAPRESEIDSIAVSQTLNDDDDDEKFYRGAHFAIKKGQQEPFYYRVMQDRKASLIKKVEKINGKKIKKKDATYFLFEDASVIRVPKKKLNTYALLPWR